MQLLFEFLPIILFFAAYKFADLYIATGVLIAAVLVQASIQWIRHRKLNVMMIVSAVLVLIFGGLTLWLHDATFIKLKPTILYLLFAATFALSRLFNGPPVIERLMGENMKLDRPIWNQLNTLWVVFFTVMAALNYYVANHFSEATWVNFKLFGLMGLMVVFALLQAAWLSSKLPPESPTDNQPKS